MPQEKNELFLQRFNPFQIFLRQLKNPLLIILVIATTVSFLLGEKTNSIVIFIMVLISFFMGFFNEYQAEKTVSDLLKRISLNAIVIRNNKKLEISVRDIVPGDTVILSAGSIVPADLKISQSHHIEIDESVLSGESYTVKKTHGDTAYMGSVVVSGNGEAVVTAIGHKTKFGQISADLSTVRPETNFEKGLSRFSLMLVRVIVVLCLLIFIVNFLLGHSPISSLLFALAIAIGLTPELFPVIVTVSLSHGSRLLSKKNVIVKQLVAIENLGNMDILCSDKTGTLTEGKISLEKYIDSRGNKDEAILDLALLCNIESSQDKVAINSIDNAVWKYAKQHHLTPLKDTKEIFESPFDFFHQSMFTVVQYPKSLQFILKGSPEKVLEKCRLTASEKDKIINLYQSFSNRGIRSVALATKNIVSKTEYHFSDATNLEFRGFVTFSDKPKPHIVHTLKQLEKLGVNIKIITGDNELVTRLICSQVGLPSENFLLGSDLVHMSDEQLAHDAPNTDFFARVTPDQKVRVIKALQSNGHSVGFLGDGINDAPALHLADVSISVNTAVDIAKDSASIVLLDKDLTVLTQGITEGRKIFANTLKYILMGTSSNFGNMFSAAAASFVLPFLPMTASQIILNNLLYDISQLSIPTDSVDLEMLERPEKWDVELIKKYMFVFGPISTLFDFATFGLMLFVFKANQSLFQTGWFVESLTTQILVIFLIRTRRSPFYKSRPGIILTVSCLLIVLVGALLPFSPLAGYLGFTPLPTTYFIILLGFTATYLGIVETVKAISKTI